MRCLPEGLPSEFAFKADNSITSDKSTAEPFGSAVFYYHIIRISMQELKGFQAASSRAFKCQVQSLLAVGECAFLKAALTRCPYILITDLYTAQHLSAVRCTDLKDPVRISTCPDPDAFHTTAVKIFKSDGAVRAEP